MDCLPHIHVAAWHAEPGFESATVGVGALCETDWQALRAGAGVYRNSEGGTSVYAVAVYQPLRIGPVKIGAAAGAATGYKRMPVTPVAGLALSVEQQRIEHHVLVIPRVRNVTPLTVQYSFTYRWK